MASPAVDIDRQDLPGYWPTVICDLADRSEISILRKNSSDVYEPRNGRPTKRINSPLPAVRGVLVGAATPTLAYAGRAGDPQMTKYLKVPCYCKSQVRLHLRCCIIQLQYITYRYDVPCASS